MAITYDVLHKLLHSKMSAHGMSLHSGITVIMLDTLIQLHSSMCSSTNQSQSSSSSGTASTTKAQASSEQGGESKRRKKKNKEKREE